MVVHPFTPPPHVESAQHGPVLVVHDDNYRWLPDGSVDLVLTDPPFNIARDTNFHTYTHNTLPTFRFDQDKGWDSHTHDDFLTLMRQWATEFARVLRPGGSFAVFCADAYLSHLRDALTAAGLKPRRTVTWRKTNPVPVNRAHMMSSACEYVVVGVKPGKQVTFNSTLPIADTTIDVLTVEKFLIADKTATVVENNIRHALDKVTSNGFARSTDITTVVRDTLLASVGEVVERCQRMYVDEGDQSWIRGCVPNHVTFPTKVGKKRTHPTEKPVPLLEYFLALFSNPGDVVLDPFAGSGSLGAAAISMGREAVLVERDDTYHASIGARLAALTPSHVDVPTLSGNNDSTSSRVGDPHPEEVEQ